MTKKVKIISIIFLAILMIVGIKFGGKKDDYFVDLQINKLYAEVNDEIVLVEGNIEEESYKLQEDILRARSIIEEFKDYTIEHDKEEDYNSIIIDWGVRVDEAQQVILSRIIDSINKAKQIKSINAIDEATLAIPSNVPDKWKNNFEKDISDIKH